MLGLPESLGDTAAFSQRRLYNGVPTRETLTLEEVAAESCHEAAPALNEASEKDSGGVGEEEVASPVTTDAQAVVGLEVVRSYGVKSL